MSTNPTPSKTTPKQRQRRQQSKKQQHQKQSGQTAQQPPQTDSLPEEEQATALPSLEEQLDCFAELLIDLYLQNQQTTLEQNENNETNLN